MDIVLTGGGTAGHVTPNIHLLPELKKHFQNISYIGSENGIEKKLITAQNIPYFSITTTKLIRKNILKNLCIPFLLIKGYMQAKKILKELHPSIIFSKGGYVSVPVVLAAKKLRIPVIIHESDLTMGLANKIASKNATLVCTSFPETAKNIKNNKGIFTGTPLPEKEKFTKKPANLSNNDAKLNEFLLNLNNNTPILLITGGSLGAQFINQQFQKEANNILKTYAVIHVTGKGNKTNISHKNYFQTEFTNCMPYCMNKANVVISRAGSNSIFELAYLQKPMLLIPLPKGNSRGDQVENAKYFVKNGWALSCNQEDVSQGKTNLLENINTLYQKRFSYIQNLKSAHFQSGLQTIVKLLCTHAKKS